MVVCTHHRRHTTTEGDRYTDQAAEAEASWQCLLQTDQWAAPGSTWQHIHTIDHRASLVSTRRQPHFDVHDDARLSCECIELPCSRRPLQLARPPLDDQLHTSTPLHSTNTHTAVLSMPVSAGQGGSTPPAHYAPHLFPGWHVFWSTSKQKWSFSALALVGGKSLEVSVLEEDRPVSD